MRFLRFVMAAAVLVASSVSASPADPRLGAEYIALPQRLPTQAPPGKVEVLEFFMYGCPHCARLEPELEAWARKQGANIVLRRMHFPLTGPNDPGAHLHLALEAMGKAEEMAPAVFNAIHKQHIRLDRDEALIFDWVGKNGIDRAKFMEAWNSFAVLTKLRQQGRAIERYQVNTAPTLVIDGRYVTDPVRVGQANRIAGEEDVMQAMPAVLDGIVAKARGQ